MLSLARWSTDQIFWHVACLYKAVKLHSPFGFHRMAKMSKALTCTGYWLCEVLFPILNCAECKPGFFSSAATGQPFKLTETASIICEQRGMDLNTISSFWNEKTCLENVWKAYLLTSMYSSTRLKIMWLLFSSLFSPLEVSRAQSDVDMNIREHKVELVLYSWRKWRCERGECPVQNTNATE